MPRRYQYLKGILTDSISYSVFSDSADRTDVYQQHRLNALKPSSEISKECHRVYRGHTRLYAPLSVSLAFGFTIMHEQHRGVHEWRCARPRYGCLQWKHLCVESTHSRLGGGSTPWVAWVTLHCHAVSELQGALVGHKASVVQLAIADNCVLSGDSDGEVRVWNLATQECLRTVLPTPTTSGTTARGAVSCLALGELPGGWLRAACLILANGWLQAE